MDLNSATNEMINSGFLSHYVDVVIGPPIYELIGPLEKVCLQQTKSYCGRFTRF